MTRTAHTLLTAFGLGHCRPASGTWGSTPPVIFALLWVSFIGIDWTVNVMLLLMCAIFTVACLRYGDQAEHDFGKKDPGQVVADEVAGQCIALLFLPWRMLENLSDTSSWSWNLSIAACAFLLFRILDITKPPPAGALQKLHGGLGIVIDDLFAGVYALLLTQVAVRIGFPYVVTL